MFKTLKSILSKPFNVEHYSKHHMLWISLDIFARVSWPVRFERSSGIFEIVSKNTAEILLSVRRQQCPWHYLQDEADRYIEL